MVQVYRKSIQKKKQNADEPAYLVRGSYESSVAEASTCGLVQGELLQWGRGCSVTKGRRGPGGSNRGRRQGREGAQCVQGTTEGRGRERRREAKKLAGAR